MHWRVFKKFSYDRSRQIEPTQADWVCWARRVRPHESWIISQISAHAKPSFLSKLFSSSCYIFHRQMNRSTPTKQRRRKEGRHLACSTAAKTLLSAPNRTPSTALPTVPHPQQQQPIGSSGQHEERRHWRPTTDRYRSGLRHRHIRFIAVEPSRVAPSSGAPQEMRKRRPTRRKETVHPAAAAAAAEADAGD